MNVRRIAAAATTTAIMLLTACTTDTPHCPTEDSCTADYDGDADRWIIEEVTP